MPRKATGTLIYTQGNGWSARIRLGVALLVVTGCASTNSTTTSATPAAAPEKPALRVSNLCSASPAGFPPAYLLHVRIDSTFTGERPLSSSVLWSFSCNEHGCHGAKVDLDAWLRGKPIGALGVNDTRGAEISDASPGGFVLTWGPRVFHVDVVAGQVQFDDDEVTTQQHGSARCSDEGVPWPAAASTGKADTHVP